MSSHSRGTSILSIGTCLEPELLGPYSHPLSPDSDALSGDTFMTSHETHNINAAWYPKRTRQASIRSESIRRNKPHHSMRRSSSSSGTKPFNARNLIFDEWITSTAHPALAAHSLIPTEIVDDDKAIRDMLTEAMNEESFVSMKRVEEQADVVRPLTPMVPIDIPVKNAELETRPRSSSSLSVRKWAGMFVGKGEVGRRHTATANPRQKLTHKRSFSAPNTELTHKSVVDDSNIDKGRVSLNVYLIYFRS